MASAPPIIDLTGGGQADGFSIPPNPFASRPRVGNGAITGIVFHHTGPGSLAGVMTGSQTQYLANGQKNPGYGTGAQYYIDTDGTIYQYAPDSSRAYNIESPGSKNRDDALAATAALANSNVIGIEMVAPDSQHLTDAQKAAGVALGTYLASKYSVDPGMIVGHGELQSNRQSTEGVGLAEATRAALASGGVVNSTGAKANGDYFAPTPMSDLYAMPAPLTPPTSDAIAQLRAQAAARQAFITSAGATAGVVIEGQASGVPPKAPLMSPKLDLGVVDPDMMGMAAPANDWLGGSGTFGAPGGVSGDVALGGFGSTAISSSGAAMPPMGTVNIPPDPLYPQIVSEPSAPSPPASSIASPSDLSGAGPVESTKTDRLRTDLANSPSTLDDLVRQVYRGTGLQPDSSGQEPAGLTPTRWMLADSTPAALRQNSLLVAPVLTSAIAFAPPDSLASTLSGTPYAPMGMAFDHFTVPAAVAQAPIQAVPKPLPVTSLERNWKQPPAPVAATVKPQPNLTGAKANDRDTAPAPATKTVAPQPANNQGQQPGGTPNYDPIGPGANFGDLQKMVDASKASAGVMTVSSTPSAKPTTTSISIVNPAYTAWQKQYGNQGNLATGTSASTVSAKFNDADGVAAPISVTDMSSGSIPAAPVQYITKQISTAAPRSSSPLSAGGYMVQSGDTLSAIAARSGVSVAALVAANGISDPNKIQAGGNLVIPGKAANSNAIPLSPSSTKNQASAKAAQNAGNGGGSNSGAATFQGSSTKTTYTVGQTYSNNAGTYVANSNGTFTKVG